MLNDATFGASTREDVAEFPSVGPRVCLVSAPFAPLEAPSLALGLLKAVGSELGADVCVSYLGFKFAEAIGYEAYQRFASGAPASHDLAGEWIFAQSALGDQFANDSDSYISDIIRGRNDKHRKRDERATRIAAKVAEDIVVARRLANDFVAQSAYSILDAKPSVVGFTSVFQQNMASLAIAKRIKLQCPEVLVVMGGANCEDPMGTALLHAFSWLDAVISGEGEEAFAELILSFRDSRPPRIVRGLRMQTKNNDALGLASGVAIVNHRPTDLDSLPMPDFAEFFDAAAGAPKDWKLEPRLVLETSRGCWWGEKHHCTFCGLNGLGLSFRRKSQGVAFRELETLTQEYNARYVAMADNILDMAYFRDYLPRLASRELDISLFYETKSNLRRDQLEQLRAANVTTIQPGIESLSDDILRIMRKGVRGIHNVQLLKWCLELGIDPEWNLLWGFPGEPEAAYVEMARAIPSLFHLPPPAGASKIRLDRFSPNFMQAAEFGLVDVRPYPAYEHVYGSSTKSLGDIAYFFTFEYLDGRNVESYTAELAEKSIEWRAEHARSVLVMVDKPPHMLLWDTRKSASTPLTVLQGWLRSLYLACEPYTNIARLEQQIRSSCSGEITREQVEHALAALVDRRLIYQSGRYFLALASTIDKVQLRASALKSLVECIRGVSTECAGELRVRLDDFHLVV